jgi:16S rRNA (uracil1498-N3)-methyltransferase
MEIFYATPDAIQGEQVKLGPKETRHIVRVLRHNVGDHVLVVDGKGIEYRCVITRIGRSEVLCDIVNRTRRAREPITEVTLAAGITKGTKMDTVVEMATELGIAQFVPLITTRTVARVTPARLRRYTSLAIAALKSSTRTMLPRIRPVQDFESFLKESNRYDLKLIAHEGEAKSRLPDVIARSVHRAVLIVGPEGGFTEAEIALSQAHGFRAFTMGPRRLRAETASIAALTMLLYELNEI